MTAIDLDNLPADVESLQELVRLLAETLHLKDTEIAGLKHRLALLCRHQFGSRSERVDPAQLVLAFLEGQGESEARAPGPPPAPPAEEPRKKGHGRRRLPPELPRERDDGGRRAAIFYSLIETCRRHGVDPFAYLRGILERVSTDRGRDIAALLPPNWKKEQEALRQQRAAAPSAPDPPPNTS